jgi:hypothetical protein
VIGLLLPLVQGRAEASAVSAGDGGGGEGGFTSFDPPAPAFDAEVYKHGNVVECCFNWLKTRRLLPVHRALDPMTYRAAPRERPVGGGAAVATAAWV